MIELSDRWIAEEPQARVGVLYLEGAENVPSHPGLTAARQDLEQELRDRYGGLDRGGIRELPAFAAYESFYRRFRKTYHVQLQLESIVFQGKSIRSPSALVECMFMAELKSGLLTAGHDQAFLELPLTADVALGSETYQRLGGSSQQLKPGDLYIKDQQGILSSIIYGPDHRTRIREGTDRVVFTTYGPPGIGEDRIQEELLLIEEYVRVLAPGANRQELLVLQVPK